MEERENEAVRIREVGRPIDEEQRQFLMIRLLEKSRPLDRTNVHFKFRIKGLDALSKQVHERQITGLPFDGENGELETGVPDFSAPCPLEMPFGLFRREGVEG